MKKILLSSVATAAFAVSTSFAIQGTNSPYTDAVGDISTNVSSASGTLDILGMEVTNNASDITFRLTVNGNISTNTGGADWGNFMIGISTGSTASTNTGNGWVRPIQLNSPLGGMDYWVGSWVNAGGGSQLWSYTGGTNGGGTGGAWSGPAGLTAYSFLAGSNSTITYTATLASLGLAVNDTFYFDAYSSSGDGTGAIDALANPNVTINDWTQPYTSSTTGDGGFGLNSYQVVPEPSTYALLALSALGLAGYAARRRAARK
jgi:hypothetical protein